MGSTAMHQQIFWHTISYLPRTEFDNKNISSYSIQTIYKTKTVESSRIHNHIDRRSRRPFGWPFNWLYIKKRDVYFT